MKATANENVVYILGAGFSAQFGLPVMSNFLEKSKDMYAIRKAKDFRGGNIDFFGDVYQEIDKLRRCKDFYASDMTNIEEILSLFEMGKMLGAEAKQQIDFQHFIAKVVDYFTPNQYYNFTVNYSFFESFIKNVLRIQETTDYGTITYNKQLPHYSILTFNYDMLWENIITSMRYKSALYKNNIGLEYTPVHQDGKLSYIKLHGSADRPETIVPPTWHKNLDNAKVWRMAGSILSRANHIRIIGYALPVTDSYLKYFLKWGAANALNLKSIDVICLDDDQHSVENRYRSFIHHKLKFYNLSTKEYLTKIQNDIESFG